MSAESIARNIVTGLCVKRAQCFGFNENEWLEDEIANAIVEATGEVIPTEYLWMPIASAPDTGKVIVFGGRHTEPTVVTADGSWWRIENLKGTPTHWLPMPKPPVSP